METQEGAGCWKKNTPWMDTDVPNPWLRRLCPAVYYSSLGVSRLKNNTNLAQIKALGGPGSPTFPQYPPPARAPILTTLLNVFTFLMNEIFLIIIKKENKVQRVGGWWLGWAELHVSGQPRSPPAAQALSACIIHGPRAR